MRVQFTCSECGSSIEVYPDASANTVQCDTCSHEMDVHFTQDHENGILKDCASCERKDFYTQKDFNRKVGVGLFIIASILSIWTYGISFIVLYAVDFFLFKKLPPVTICYKCNTNYRQVKNASEIAGFNHEMNDRIVYSDHDFQGRVLDH